MVNYAQVATSQALVQQQNASLVQQQNTESVQAKAENVNVQKEQHNVHHHNVKEEELEINVHKSKKKKKDKKVVKNVKVLNKAVDYESKEEERKEYPTKSNEKKKKKAVEAKVEKVEEVAVKAESKVPKRSKKVKSKTKSKTKKRVDSIAVDAYDSTDEDYYDEDISITDSDSDIDDRRISKQDVENVRMSMSVDKLRESKATAGFKRFKPKSALFDGHVPSDTGSICEDTTLDVRGNLRHVGMKAGVSKSHSEQYELCMQMIQMREKEQLMMLELFIASKDGIDRRLYFFLLFSILM